MVPASSALPTRQRDILSVLIGLLLLLGVFGVVMHGLDTGSVVQAKSTPDLTDLTPRPEVKGEVLEPVATTVTTAPPVTTPPAPKKFATSTFRASFPVEPKKSTMEFKVDDFSLPMTFYATDQPDIVFGVAYFALPADASIDLNRAAKGSALGSGGELKSTLPTTFGGHRAVDVRIEIGDGTMHELIVRTPNHVFMILVGGEGDPAKEFYDFRDSVELLV